MEKIIRLGTMKTYNGRAYSIYCSIRVEANRLSISGVEGPTPGGNCLGACGQIDMHLRDEQSEINLAPGWTRDKLKQFFDIWERWHLNDMRAECEHQRALGWKYNDHIEDKKTFQGEACPTCGYRIGSAWLKEDLPVEVIDFLTSLPETDKTPAWV